jgi:hypothetical protein
MSSSWMLSRVGLVRADVSEERIESIIRATRISELGRTLPGTSNRRGNLKSYMARLVYKT